MSVLGFNSIIKTCYLKILKNVNEVKSPGIAKVLHPLNYVLFKTSSGAVLGDAIVVEKHVIEKRMKRTPMSGNILMVAAKDEDTLLLWPTPNQDMIGEYEAIDYSALAKKIFAKEYGDGDKKEEKEGD